MVSEVEPVPVSPTVFESEDIRSVADFSDWQNAVEPGQLRIVWDRRALPGTDRDKLRDKTQHAPKRNHRRKPHGGRTPATTDARCERLASGGRTVIEFLQQLINGLGQGAIYALIALGYTMVFGVLRFINFAHGDVYMLGAFAGLYVGPRVARVFGEGPSYPGMFAVLLAAMLICAVIGIVIERLCYRPLRERPKLTVLITAIGVSLFLENGGQFAFGANPQSFPEVIADRAIEIPESWGSISGLTITVSQVLIVGVTLVLLFTLRHIVLHTRMGMAMRALSFNPVAASLMGINNDVVISFTFGLGSALAGAAGILTSIQQPSIDPLMGARG